MIILVLLIAFKVFFIAFPDITLPAARDGLLLWFNNVLPALLPFMIVSNLLTGMGYSRFLGRFFAPIMRRVFGLPGVGGVALVTGLTSGYPIGAKTVADLRKSGQLSIQEAQHLLAFCNNAGPLFILGVVGVGLFGSTKIGYLLLAAHIFAALTIGVVMRFLIHKNNQPISQTTTIEIATTNFNSALGNAVKNAMESMAVIGGLIIFFNTATAIIMQIALPDSGLFSGLATALVEVTSGVRRISEMGATTESLAIAAFAIAFGGFSIHMQTFHFTENTGIRTVTYLLCKILHGIVAAVVTVMLWLAFSDIIMV